MKRFKLSTEVLFSEDAIDALLEVKDVNAVLITDKFMVDSGMADMILKKLSNCNSVSVFSEVIPDPPMDLIERGIDFLQDKECDVVVALGGAPLSTRRRRSSSWPERSSLHRIRRAQRK